MQILKVLLKLTNGMLSIEWGKNPNVKTRFKCGNMTSKRTNKGGLLIEITPKSAKDKRNSLC